MKENRTITIDTEAKTYQRPWSNFLPLRTHRTSELKRHPHHRRAGRAEKAGSREAGKKVLRKRHRSQCIMTMSKVINDELVSVRC